MQPIARPPPAIAAGSATVNLRYLAGAPLRVQGAVTARSYAFSASQPVQAVAAADAPELLTSL